MVLEIYEAGLLEARQYCIRRFLLVRSIAGQECSKVNQWDVTRGLSQHELSTNTRQCDLQVIMCNSTAYNIRCHVDT